MASKIRVSRGVHRFLSGRSCRVSSLPSRSVSRGGRVNVSSRSQEQNQTLDHVLDGIRQSSKRWNDRFTLENPRFIEKYKQGELQILLEFSSGIVDVDYVVLFQGCPVLG